MIGFAIIRLLHRSRSSSRLEEYANAKPNPLERVPRQSAKKSSKG
jgi:hypothetical protein